MNDLSLVFLELLRSPFWRAVVIFAEIVWAVSVGLKIWMFPLERRIKQLEIQKLKLEVKPSIYTEAINVLLEQRKANNE